ncbi:MAG: ATP synthase F1 subunit gamma [Holosporales bacterium]|jgi:F-type H+-transporting ATPase subunit gamma|nr:ATP synthase F1 subunit gamma [Holosporales bacterium]
MASLRDIKKRVASVRSTHKLISAMKLIAASRFRQSLHLLQFARDYEKSLADVLRTVLSDKDNYQICKQLLPSYFFDEIPSKPYVICVFGAQKGLCGNYNLAVIKEALALETRNQEHVCEFVPMTLKTAEYFTKHRPKQAEPLAGLGHFPTNATCMELANYVFEHVQKWYANENVGAVSIVCGKFINTLNQDVESFDLYPIRIIASQNIAEKAQQGLTEKTQSTLGFRLIEPSVEVVVEKIFKKLVLTRLYKAFLEAETCEYAARMTMMDSSKRNAEELIDKLSLQYNRTRQANITNELIEIIAGTATHG